MTEEYTPKLFSEDVNQHETSPEEENDQAQSERLFDQDAEEEESFEIPAFLRKQKF